jgi:hypothetical protein
MHLLLQAILTEEHIVPEALSGTWVIKRSACDTCRDKTNEDYEQAVLKCDMLRIARKILELRRKRAKKKAPLETPPTFPYGTAAQSSVSGLSSEVDLGQYPPLFAMMIAEPATPLQGSVLADRNSFQMWISFLQKGKPNNFVVSDPVTLPDLYKTGPGLILSADVTWQGNPISVRQRFAMREFMLMVAKIGYSFAIAERGLEGFDGAEIRQLLQGERDDVYNFVGGSVDGERLTRRHLHHLDLRQRGDLLTVIVHLFASYEAPPYEVVVGRTSR